MARPAPLLVAISLVLGACTPRTRPVVVTDLPSSDVEVVLRGKTLGHFSGPRIQFPAPTRFKAADGSDLELDDTSRADESFWLRVHTPCGEETWCLRFPNELPPGRSTPIVAEARERRDAQRGDCSDDQTDAIWFDDRGGPAHVLTVGSNTTRTIAAGSFSKVEVRAPACAADGRVTVDGRTIGALPAFFGMDFQKGRLDASPRSFVVDPTGTRCYQFDEFFYGLPGSSTDSPPPSAFLKGDRLYPLAGMLDDGPLKKAPDSVEGYGETSRAELLDASCTQAP